VIIDWKWSIDILHLLTPSYDFQQSPFIETERVPKDAEIIRYTWKYVNKSGWPDKRFKDNREVPVALYAEFTLETEEGLYEKFQFSNYDVALAFIKAFGDYTKYLEGTK
jgi:hypothetical protein